MASSLPKFFTKSNRLGANKVKDEPYNNFDEPKIVITNADLLKNQFEAFSNTHFPPVIGNPHKKRLAPTLRP